MDASDFRRLFVYDHWANKEVLVALRSAEARPPSSLRYTAHIVAAERLWLERLEQRGQTLPVWPDFTVDQCESQAAELCSLWQNFLSAADLSNEISYITITGTFQRKFPSQCRAPIIINTLRAVGSSFVRCGAAAEE
jgi:uncharacterized damage-inducible protein DinB